MEELKKDFLLIETESFNCKSIFYMYAKSASWYYSPRLILIVFLIVG